MTAICRRLDALPLALEIAAPWIKVLTPEDLLGRLMRDALLSTTGPRDLPERQQTISATVAWSYQLLDPSQQRAFRRLGALPARFSIEAATAVLGGSEGSTGEDEALGAVAGLIDKACCCELTPQSRRGRCTRCSKRCAPMRPPEPARRDERDDALEGLTRHCTSEASRAADALIGHAQAEWLDRVREDLENYRVVLAWLIERGVPRQRPRSRGG